MAACDRAIPCLTAPFPFWPILGKPPTSTPATRCPSQTPGGLDAPRLKGLTPEEVEDTQLPGYIHARYVALRPGGIVTSRFLANQNTVMTVGSSVFAHGGLLPEHVDHGLDGQFLCVPVHVPVSNRSVSPPCVQRQPRAPFHARLCPCNGYGSVCRAAVSPLAASPPCGAHGAALDARGAVLRRCRRRLLLTATP